ncbi:MAG: DUF6165 family protein [Bacteriovoracia bacterium]
MGMIKAEVSAGELLDKISILEIKAEKIHQPDKLKNVRFELAKLRQVRDEELRNWHLTDDLYISLKAVNEALWEIEDQLRILERRKDFSQEFIKLARMVYFENDKRARLKRAINEKLGSSIIEEKQYVDYSTSSP